MNVSFISGDFDYWIPVSQKLPPDNKHVLLYLEKECAYDYPPSTMIDWWVQEGFYNREHGFFVCYSPDLGRGIKDDYVKAWTALPQPYKGDIDGLG